MTEAIDHTTATIHDFTPDNMMSAVPDTPDPVTLADVYAEVVAIRNDISMVVALVEEVGPTLALLMEEAKEKGLMGLLPMLMSLRKG